MLTTRIPSLMFCLHGSESSTSLSEGRNFVRLCNGNRPSEDYVIKELVGAFEGDKEEARCRFFTKLCRLVHPNVVRTFRADCDAKNNVCLIMEHVHGRHPCVDGPGFTPGLDGRKLTILRDLASALDYLHECGILHLDVKPGNVLVAADGHAKLIDFDASVLMDNGQMKASMLAGTPAYMAPETCHGSMLSAAADQWSLAVFAYELISGNLPFRLHDCSRYQGAQVAAACMNDSVFLHQTQPMGVTMVGEKLAAFLHDMALLVGKAVPDDIANLNSGSNRVLKKALSKDPARRFSTCAEFIRALEEAGEKKPDIDPCNWTVGLTFKWVIFAVFSSWVYLISAFGPAFVCLLLMIGLDALMRSGKCKSLRKRGARQCEDEEKQRLAVAEKAAREVRKVEVDDIARAHNAFENKDYKTGFDIAVKLGLAKISDPYVTYHVGYCYSPTYKTAYPKDKDYQRSYQWFCRTAELEELQGDGVVECILGDMLMAGHGVERDVSKAVEFYSRSSQRNCERGCYELARCYEKGLAKDGKNALETARQLYEKFLEISDLEFPFREDASRRIEAIKRAMKNSLKEVDVSSEVCDRTRKV